MDSPTHRSAGAPHLWLAVHEAAHAVAGLALDELPPYPGPFLRSVSALPGAGTLGHCAKPMRVVCDMIPLAAYPAEFRDNAAIQCRYDIIESLAGPMAEARQRGGMMAVAVSRRQWIATLLDVDPVDETEDAARIQQSLAWLDTPDRAAEIDRLWSVAQALLHAEWPGICAMGRVLRDAGQIEGHAFKLAWLAARPAAKARQRRLEMAGLAEDWRLFVAAPGQA